MKLQIFLFFLLTPVLFYGQYIQRSTLGISGSSNHMRYQERNYYINHSIGQRSVIGTYYSNDVTVIQGFQHVLFANKKPFFQNENWDISIYPNPSNSFINIVVAKKYKILSFKLVNSLGQVIEEGTIYNKDITQLDVTNLTNGVYLLSIRSKNKKSNFKILKV